MCAANNFTYYIFSSSLRTLSVLSLLSLSFHSQFNWVRCIRVLRFTVLLWY